MSRGDIYHFWTGALGNTACYVFVPFFWSRQTEDTPEGGGAIRCLGPREQRHAPFGVPDSPA